MTTLCFEYKGFAMASYTSVLIHSFVVFVPGGECEDEPVYTSV